jgi:hypothetical protein
MRAMACFLNRLLCFFFVLIFLLLHSLAHLSGNDLYLRRVEGDALLLQLRGVLRRVLLELGNASPAAEVDFHAAFQRHKSPGADLLVSDRALRLVRVRAGQFRRELGRILLVLRRAFVAAEVDLLAVLFDEDLLVDRLARDRTGDLDLGIAARALRCAATFSAYFFGSALYWSGQSEQQK